MATSSELHPGADGAVAAMPPMLVDQDREAETPPLFVLQPTRGFLAVNWRELWHYRDLLYFLTWREVSIRYKQTLLGFAWAVLQPVLTMVVFTAFLGRVAKVPGDGVPYSVFAYLGILPWSYFSGAVSRSATSLVTNQNLLSKVYFPRLLIPLSGTLSALVDFAIAFGVLIVLMFWYGLVPAPTALLYVPLVVLTAATATGIGMWLAAINVRYRDVQHAVPFLVQIWMFATPVVYPLTMVNARWRPLLALNPMTGIIEAYRSSMLGRPIDWTGLATATLLSMAALISGFWYFRRTERSFADIV